jgi:hypothetical protein
LIPSPSLQGGEGRPGLGRSGRLYEGESAIGVAAERGAIESTGAELVEADLLAGGDLIRHDPAKLSRAVLAVAELRRANGE